MPSCPYTVQAEGTLPAVVLRATVNQQGDTVQAGVFFLENIGLVSSAPFILYFSVA
jgi:hypothetical protein